MRTHNAVRCTTATAKQRSSSHLRLLTLHADEQQVGCQLSPVSLGLLLVDPVPVETKEVENNLLPNCVVQGLLQIDSWKKSDIQNAYDFRSCS